MKKLYPITLPAALAASLLTLTARAQEKLVPGKDRIDTPAIDTGLCVHNAFQSKMVDEGTYIREAHYQTFLKLRKAGDKTIGYASSFDQHRAFYHPQIKIPVGERIASWALTTQYGKNIRWLPPQIQEVTPTNGKLVLKLGSDVTPYDDGTKAEDLKRHIEEAKALLKANGIQTVN